MTPADAPAVHLSGLRLDRGGRTILRGIDLTVPRGSIAAVLGPSGSGKRHGNEQLRASLLR